MFIYIYTCNDIRAHARTRTHTHTHYALYTSAHIHVCLHVCMHAYVHISHLVRGLAGHNRRQGLGKQRNNIFGGAKQHLDELLDKGAHLLRFDGFRVVLVLESERDICIHTHKQTCRFRYKQIGFRV